MSINMAERLAATNAPAWPAALNGEKGDILEGVVLNRSTRTSVEYAPYEILTIKPSSPPTIGLSVVFNVRIDGEEVPYDGGPLAWHAMGAVAAKRVEETNPQPGDNMGTMFDGKRVGQSGAGKGKEYAVWQVVVDHLAPANGAAPAAQAPAAVDDYEDEEAF